MTLSNRKSLSAIFQFPEDDLPGPGQFRLMTSRNHLSPEDDFRQLVSSNPFFRLSKMTFRRGLANSGLL
jgi:hypothetical protein